MHEQPRAGATHMALIKEDPVDDALDRLIQRRVVEHDVRRFATEFQGHLLVRARERAHDDLADFRRPRERNLRRNRVIQHRRPDIARTRYKIHHARRQARVLQNFCELQTRDRRRLGRLEHDRIPHRQRRREFPRQHQQRKIPRNHLAHHTERRDPTTRRHVVEFVRPTGVIKKVRRRHRYIEIPRFLDRLATIQRLRDGKLPRTILQQPRDAEEILRPLAARQLAPDVIVRRLRRLIRRIDIGGTRLRDLSQLVLVGRIDGVEIFPRLRGDELPVDEELVARLEFRIGRLRRRIKLPQVAKDQLRRRTSRTGGGFLGSQSGHGKKGLTTFRG